MANMAKMSSGWIACRFVSSTDAISSPSVSISGIAQRLQRRTSKTCAVVLDANLIQTQAVVVLIPSNKMLAALWSLYPQPQQQLQPISIQNAHLQSEVNTVLLRLLLALGFPGRANTGLRQLRTTLSGLAAMQG